MKKNQFFSMLAFAGSILLVTSCSKTGPAGPAGNSGPAGPSLTGNLKGHIFQYDQYGSPILTGLAGIRDSLNPTNIAVTDTGGFYKFTGLTTGDYSFSVSKAGYGTVIAQELQIVGGGDIYHDLRIAQIPNFAVTTPTATLNGVTGNIDITANVGATDTKTREVLIFVGSSPSTSSNPATYLNVYAKTIAATKTSVINSLAPSDIHDLGINTGGTLYVSVYAATVTYNSASFYQDLATGKTVYTALGATPMTCSVIAP